MTITVIEALLLFICADHLDFFYTQLPLLLCLKSDRSIHEAIKQIVNIIIFSDSSFPTTEHECFNSHPPPSSWPNSLALEVLEVGRGYYQL